MALDPVLGFVTVVAVTLGFTLCRASVVVLTFCLAVALVAGVAVVGRVVELAGLVVVVGVTVRLVAEVFAGFAVTFVFAGRLVVVVEGLVVVVAGRVVVVEVEGLAVVVVGCPCVEGVRLMFCCALW